MDHFKYFLELFSWSLIIEDIKNVYSSGDIVDMSVYTVVIFLVLVLGIYILSYVSDFSQKAVGKVKDFTEWSSKEARTKRKADKYTKELKEFERELSDKEAKEKARKAKEAEIARQKLQQKKELMQAEELVAFSELDYAFFMPENGYPNGPSFEHRLKLEEERIRRSERRLLNSKEQQFIKNGLSADGTPFGDSAHQELFAKLWTEGKRSNVVKGFTGTSSSSSSRNPKSSGNVISLPVHKK